ncbi:MAG: DUF2007 domain-containing protein [Planctomycetota bacterium]
MAISQLVPVVECSSAEQAMVVEALLIGAGVHCLRHEAQESIGEPITGQLGGSPTEAVTILVRQSELDRAREILGEGEELGMSPFEDEAE